jgi:tripartite ATP-independent transporter DctM subunit
VGIYGGVFTPTEAGAIGVFGSMVITVAMRRLGFKQYLDSLLEAAQTTSMVFMLMIGANILSKFLAISRLPIQMGMAVANLPVPPLVIFFGVILLYIVLGMFLDIISAIILTIPIIYPLVLALGYDPIWFGIVLVILIQMGLITPPVGLDAFVLAGVVDVPLAEIFKGAIPFLLMDIVCIVIITIFPQIVLFLPGTM